MSQNILGTLSATTNQEAKAWEEYLLVSHKYLKGDLGKGNKQLQINQVNNIGSNIVKNRAVKTALAGIYLNALKNKKVLGAIGNKRTAPELLLSSL